MPGSGRLVRLELTGVDFAAFTVAGRCATFGGSNTWERLETGKRSLFSFGLTTLRKGESEIGVCSIGNAGLSSTVAPESSAVVLEGSSNSIHSGSDSHGTGTGTSTTLLSASTVVVSQSNIWVASSLARLSKVSG